MFRASQSRISRTILALLMPVAFMVAPVGASPAAAAGRTALINGDTVTGSPSQEEQIAAAQGFTVTVVDDATWGGMTAAQFGAYDLLIAGDPTCGSLPPGLISSASVYGPVVLGVAGGRTSVGNRVVVGTDPVFHDFGDYTSAGARGTIIRDGIAYAGTQPGGTGMYFDATCAGPLGQSAGILAILGALSAGTGGWTTGALPPCGGSVSLIASNSSFADLTTASLQGWSCSVHESFPTFPSDWSALAVATDTATTPTCGVDPNTSLSACGEAYILIAGSNIVVNSQVLSVSPLDATNPVGTNHTVTANVLDVGLAPLAGQLVDFSVTGVNAGASGTCVPADCKSDASGNVSFTYLGGATVGDDTIKASFTDSLGSLQTATAQKHWTSAPPAQANLTLVKNVVNTGGGTTAATAWTLNASGPTPISGHSGDESITGAAVDAGSYTLSESPGPSGYNAGSWSCLDDVTTASLPADPLVLAPGDSATCSITNTFNPAHLTLVKNVVNTGGGTTAATAWTLSASGPALISGHTGDGTITNAAVPAGTYTLTESTGPATGYHASAWSCNAGTLTVNSLALAPGTTATCSITNTFDATTNTSTTITCPPTQSCTTAPITSSGGSIGTIVAGPGATINAAFIPFAGAGFTACRGQTPRDPLNVLRFNVTGSTASKVITLVVKGKGPVPICWNAPTTFRTRDGNWARRDPLGGFTGLLPDCSGRNPVGPCILSAVERETGHRRPPPSPTTTVRILAAPGDPQMRA